ncbi:Zn finger domain containing protein [Babesia caballi]|uniref:Zn finger domain containing protein n=1 Tax=Babesia caballi TaxID=5871 RepID=A0AAV4M0C3_BABCB|nr:Zn finger domain containing protein [Babesia caballi]
MDPPAGRSQIRRGARARTRRRRLPQEACRERAPERREGRNCGSRLTRRQNYKHQKKFEDLTARLQAATAERNRLRRLCLVKAKETLSSFDTHFFSTVRCSYPAPPRPYINPNVFTHRHKHMASQYRRAVADETCLREEADSLHQRYVALNGVLEDLKSCYERISEEKLLM